MSNMWAWLEWNLPNILMALFATAMISFCAWAFWSTAVENNQRSQRLVTEHCRVVGDDRGIVVYACDGGRYIVR